MGDHRASIKIEAAFHGVKRSVDMWINYSPDTSDYDGVDYRVVDFFRELYAAGMAVYNEEIAEFYEREAALEIERAERAELAKLKAKYDPPPSTEPPNG